MGHIAETIQVCAISQKGFKSGQNAGQSYFYVVLDKIQKAFERISTENEYFYRVILGHPVILRIVKKFRPSICKGCQKIPIAKNPKISLVNSNLVKKLIFAYDF